MTARWAIRLLRIALGSELIVWIPLWPLDGRNAQESDFATGLAAYASDAAPPAAWLIDFAVLPNLEFMAALVAPVQVSIAAALIFGVFPFAAAVACFGFVAVAAAVRGALGAAGPLDAVILLTSAICLGVLAGRVGAQKLHPAPAPHRVRNVWAQPRSVLAAQPRPAMYQPPDAYGYSVGGPDGR